MLSSQMHPDVIMLLKDTSGSLYCYFFSRTRVLFSSIHANHHVCMCILYV